MDFLQKMSNVVAICKSLVAIWCQRIQTLVNKRPILKSIQLNATLLTVFTVSREDLWSVLRIKDKLPDSQGAESRADLTDPIGDSPGIQRSSVVAHWLAYIQDMRFKIWTVQTHLELYKFFGSEILEVKVDRKLLLKYNVFQRLEFTSV